MIHKNRNNKNIGYMVAPSNKRAILSVCKYTCRTNCQKHQQFDQINCTRKTSKLSFVSAFSFNFKIQCDICFTTFEKKIERKYGNDFENVIFKNKKNNCHYFLLLCIIFVSLEINICLYWRVEYYTWLKACAFW